MNPSTGKFPLGHIVATPNAVQALSPEDIKTALSRHVSGDWGDVSDEDRKENEFSLSRGFRLFSVYRAQNGTTFWIMTEADRSSTCILLPEDY